MGRSMVTGSGSIFMETEDYYGILTNHHVASNPGTVNEIDVWNYGRLAGEVKTKTYRSWFTNGASRDVAVLRIKKDSLPGPMPVIPLAPYGSSKNLKAGMTLFTVGCSNGRWPRLRVGNIVEVRNGVIFYEPASIPGDSGGPCYSADGKTQIGLTAWRIERNGKTLGMAMTSDRVHDIINGRTSSGDFALPEGAVQLKQDLCEELPLTATRVPKFKTIELEVLTDLDFWRLPGTNPAEGDKTIPPTPIDTPKYIIDDDEVGIGLFQKLRDLIIENRDLSDKQFGEQAGLLAEIIANRRAYRLEIERLRQEELERQRKWEEEQRNEWAIQQGFIARTIEQFWYWMKMIGWGVGITTTVAVVAMFFGQAWGALLLFGLGNGILTVVGFVGRGLGNVMTYATSGIKTYLDERKIEKAKEKLKEGVDKLDEKLDKFDGEDTK